MIPSLGEVLLAMLGCWVIATIFAFGLGILFDLVEKACQKLWRRFKHGHTSSRY